MKTIVFKTNVNAKLHADCFLHIDHAPAGGVCETIMESTVVEIKTEDGSHPPVRVKLVDICRQGLFQLTNISTYQSHGMEAQAFIDHFLKQNNNASLLTPVAVYFYKKLSAISNEQFLILNS